MLYLDNYIHIETKALSTKTLESTLQVTYCEQNIEFNNTLNNLMIIIIVLTHT